MTGPITRYPTAAKAAGDWENHSDQSYTHCADLPIMMGRRTQEFALAAGLLTAGYRFTTLRFARGLFCIAVQCQGRL